jgi:hypothetical protein
MKSIHAQFDADDEKLFVFANYFLGRGEIDLTVIKKDAIIVIELKEFPLPFTATENGVWVSLDEKVTFSNEKYNPYRQIIDYRHIWMNFLNRAIDPRIMGFVCISPELQKEIKINISKVPWFRVIGLDNLPKEINNVAMDQMEVSPNYVSGSPGRL